MNKFLIITFCLTLHLGQAQRETMNKPNILFILADDLGINALNCYGNPLVESPNIDKLFSEGMHFTNGYSNDPTCAPSRASILSGQYVPRHQVYRVADRFKNDTKTLYGMQYLPPDNYTLKGSGVGLPLDKITIAEALKNNGYMTAAYGKWHLGHNELQIQNQGFDEGFEIKGHYNFKTYPKQKNVDTSLYSADYITEKTIDFIKKAKASKKPFFAYAPYYLVHKPLEPNKEYLEYFKHKLQGNKSVGPDEIKVLAMIKSLDESVGKLLDNLKKLGLENETIIVFTSDNGHYKTESNIFSQPYRGVKGETFEGGIRVPYIFKWSNHIAPNSISKEPIIHIDLFPTLLGLTRTNPPKNYTLDGEDLSPILLGKSNHTLRDALIWEYTNYAGYNPKNKTFKSQWVNVIQMDGFKLTEVIENHSYFMYNLKNDPYETKDIYQDYPFEANKLKQRLEEWKNSTKYVGPVKNPNFTRSN
ncbi:sulfatase [Aestuariibaculum suncheonense]|uniref:Sulfatase n=1 Tax=Aestuariibaculum suncheonense TaxID=1028745 RepID=A0A8J6UAS8_9FLAO|nr:sulfatase [Aestuariibaculum suncheonense]MBD0835648.1 sulfatase [Aestuariibaculum suncheonense]